MSKRYMIHEHTYLSSQVKTLPAFVVVDGEVLVVPVPRLNRIGSLCGSNHKSSSSSEFVPSLGVEIWVGCEGVVRPPGGIIGTASSCD